MVPINPTPEQLAARNAATGYKPNENPINSPGGIQPGSSVSNQGKPGYDVFGNPVASSSTPATPAISSEYYSRTGAEPTPVVAETADQIQERKVATAKGMIDNLNKYYDSEVANQTTINEGRSRGNNAISALTGLSGSTEANVTADKTNVANKRELDAINQQRAVAIQGILSKISDSAVEEARQSRAEARQSAQDIQAYRLKAQTDAVDNLTKLSKTTPGLTLDGLKATLSPEDYTHLIKNAGGEALAKAIIFEGRAKDTVLGTPQLIGDHMVQAYTAPDGTVRYENVPLPEGVKANKDNIKSIEKTDNGIFIINKDGTWSTIKGSGAIKTGPKQTQSEITQNTISQYSQAFSPGIKLKDGTPTVSPDGFATFGAWKEAIKEAPTKGVTRAEFIKNFGNLLLVQNGKIPDEYGLTTVEKRLILGTEDKPSDKQKLIDSIVSKYE